MPTDLARERGAVLHRALRGVPTELLAPLLRGTRRHADALVPGALFSGGGGCVVGMMLLELNGDSTRKRRLLGARCTIHEEAPDLARKYPRLAHIEFIYDRTVEELHRRTPGAEWQEAARTTGLWMASEVSAEINLRHLEEAAEGQRPAAGATVDEKLFADTVARIRKLRPWLGEAQACAIVESIVGVRRVDSLTVPLEWEHEVELQRERLEQTA